MGPKQKNMKQDEYFLRFQQLCIGILAQSDNCMESQQQFKAARSVPELVTAWQRFWAGVLHEVPEQVIKAFADLYPVYRDDIIRAGVYYNEAPPVGIYPENPISPISPSDAATVHSASPLGPTTNAMILIGDAPSSPVLGDSVAENEATVPDDSPSGETASPSDLVIHGRNRVYVLGNLPVTVTDNSSVHINSARANVTVTGSARANIEQGTLIARDRAVVNGKGDITCYDSTTIYVSGGVLHDKGHLDIIAYNDAVINSFTSRRIKLNDQARLVIE